MVLGVLLIDLNTQCVSQVLSWKWKQDIYPQVCLACLYCQNEHRRYYNINLIIELAAEEDYIREFNSLYKPDYSITKDY